jgi:hypothetical protein
MLRLILNGILKLGLHGNKIGLPLLQVLNCFAQDGLGFWGVHLRENQSICVGTDPRTELDCERGIWGNHDGTEQQRKHYNEFPIMASSRGSVMLNDYALGQKASS